MVVRNIVEMGLPVFFLDTTNGCVNGTRGFCAEIETSTAGLVENVVVLQANYRGRWVTTDLKIIKLEGKRGVEFSLVDADFSKHKRKEVVRVFNKAINELPDS